MNGDFSGLINIWACKWTANSGCGLCLCRRNFNCLNGDVMGTAGIIWYGDLRNISSFHFFMNFYAFSLGLSLEAAFLLPWRNGPAGRSSAILYWSHCVIECDNQRSF
jgi:hypothetical protein